mgnify:CR=1 FL=1|jgi:hypothetical protein
MLCLAKFDTTGIKQMYMYRRIPGYFLYMQSCLIHRPFFDGYGTISQNETAYK